MFKRNPKCGKETSIQPWNYVLIRIPAASLAYDSTRNSLVSPAKMLRVRKHINLRLLTRTLLSVILLFGYIYPAIRAVTATCADMPKLALTYLA